jgi:hypothetical protein
MSVLGLVAGGLALGGQSALSGASSPSLGQLDPVCDQLSPVAFPCVLLDKVAEGASAECRALALLPAQDCLLPIGHQVIPAQVQTYLTTWLHGAVAFQYKLQDPLPISQEQWVGTHNSFNSPAAGLTLSHEDSNQQLTLPQQLGIDVRSLELDTHWLPALNAAGGTVIICHGQAYSEANLGCTIEPPLTQVLPQIDSWLVANPTQVILLYLDDNFGPSKAYTAAVNDLEAGLRRPGGSSLIYHPQPSAIGSHNCEEMPLGVTRDQIRSAGAQVLIVGDCENGWSSDVFGWDDHVESGNTAAYQPFPICDTTYSRQVYNSEFVRYFEDSTLVTALTSDTTENWTAYEANMLTPDKVTSMIDCGVNLFGFDQILPFDGRLAADVWSWDTNQPDLSAGNCTVQESGGRWQTDTCGTSLPAACQTPTGWTLTSPVPFANAAAACGALDATFALPMTGYENSLLHAGTGGQEVWIDYQAGPGD